MKEQNILAAFHSEDEANQAAHALKQAGFSIVSIDRIGPFAGDGNEKILNPITGDFPGLASLTLAGDFPNGPDASVLAAASPDASGMSDRGDDTLHQSVLLTAVVPEEQGDQATKIVRSHGGMV